jgi:hypothetical protein
MYTLLEVSRDRVKRGLSIHLMLLAKISNLRKLVARMDIYTFAMRADIERVIRSG